MTTSNELIKKVIEKDGRAVQELINSGADVNYRDNEGRSALHYAVDQWEDHWNIVEMLLCAGADMNAQDDTGKTPLHISVSHNNPNMLITRALLMLGADPNVQDNNGRAPLHEAAGNKDEHCVKLLLEHGAKADIEDYWCQKPAHFARNCNNEEVKKTLAFAERQGWRKINQESISFTQTVGDHEIAEIFNFLAQERTTICANRQSNTDVMTLTRFTELPPELLTKAAGELLDRGGNDYTTKRVKKEKYAIGQETGKSEKIEKFNIKSSEGFSRKKESDRSDAAALKREMKKSIKKDL